MLTVSVASGTKNSKAVTATFRTWNAERVTIRPVVKTLAPGTYGIYVNGGLERVGSCGVSM
jgi:hypothetical protein